MKIPDNIYNSLKWVCLICLPALAFGYDQLSGIWGWPLKDEIPATINLIATVLGLLIGISTYNYKQENNIIVKKKTEVVEDEGEQL